MFKLLAQAFWAVTLVGVLAFVMPGARANFMEIIPFTAAGSATDYTAHADCQLALLCDTATETADSCGSATLTDNGDVTQDTGDKFGGAGSCDFDSDDDMSCDVTGACTGLDFRGSTTGYTISGATKHVATDNWKTLASMGKAGGSDHVFKSYHVSGGAGSENNGSNNSGTTLNEIGTTVTANAAWTFICHTFSHTTEAKIYRNGVNDCDGACRPGDGASLNNPANVDDQIFYVGVQVDASNVKNSYINALVDELMVFDSVLTEAQCCELCRFGPDGSESDRTALCNACTLP